MLKQMPCLIFMYACPAHICYSACVYPATMRSSCSPPLHCTKQGSPEHRAWPGPCWQDVLPDWKHLLPVAMHLHGIGRAPTATLLHMRWVSMHLHRYRGGDGLACRIGFVSTSMSVWHAWYLQGGIDLFRLFVEIGRPFKQKKKANKCSQHPGTHKVLIGTLYS